ncbi:MAG: hypothetical protein WDO74_28935 [Pseudomonadota bacterium]
MFKFHPFLALAVLCAACGARFAASDGSGSSGGAGKAGEASGGLSNSAGSSSAGDAGELEAGGTGAAGEGATAGEGSTAGQGGAGSGNGGAGSGGAGNGGALAGSAGSAGADCALLRQQYAAAVEKARVCDRGSTDQCSPSSVAQPVDGCGCPVLINAKSEAAATVKKAYQAYQDSKCETGVLCDIACVPQTSAYCAQQSMASGGPAVCVSNWSGMQH